MDSFIKWMGGKSYLRNEIIPMIPPHKTYIEPFGGACWVLFGKPKSPVEIINDIDNELINLYLTINNNLDEFIDTLESWPISEYLFNELARKGIPSNPEGNVYPTDRRGIPSKTSNEVYPSSSKGIPSRAAKTYYLIMNAFNGNISNNPSFVSGPNRQQPFVKFHKTDWEAVKDRLKYVTIMSQDFENIIKKFDSDTSFFYLDPPYTIATDSRRYYRYTFAVPDHERLAVYLSDIRGKFIMSYDNVPKILKRYTDFNITKTSNGELLIHNYDISDRPFYCSKGIPTPAAKGIPNLPGSWFNRNCPYCGSRSVQQSYKRVTIDSKKRNFIKYGYICNDCEGVFK